MVSNIPIVSSMTPASWCSMRATRRIAARSSAPEREVQAAQAIIANARSVMLVADSTKLERSAPVRIAHLSQIQTFVTDLPLPPGLQNICAARGISVITAMGSKGVGDKVAIGEAAPEPESGS